MSSQKKVMVLAGSLNRNAKIAALRRATIKILAEGETPSGLKVLKHGDGAKFAYEMYQEYVSESNFQYFPDFMQKLDTMLFEFRGNQTLEVAEDDDEDDEEDTRSISSKRKGRGKKKYKPIKKAKAVKPIPSSENESDEDVPDENSVVVSSLINRLKKRTLKKAA